VAYMVTAIMFKNRYNLWARYFMAKAILTSTKKIREDQFLMRPIGRRYFNKSYLQWSYVFDKPSIFIKTSPDVSSALQFISAKYRKYLIKKCILTLMNPKAGVSIVATEVFENSKESKKERISLLAIIDELTLNSEQFEDEISLWWAHVIRQAFYWLTDNEEQAQSVVVEFPTSLRNNSLAISLLLASCLRKYLTLKGDRIVGLGGSSNQKPHRNFTLLLDRASYELRRSFEASAGTNGGNCDDCYQQLVEAFQLLACDWLLSTRIQLWQKMFGKDANQDPAIRNRYVSSFRQDLATLRYLITQSIPAAKTKLYHYEGAYRLMAGTNPLEAQHYFNRSLRKRNLGTGSSLICVNPNLVSGAGSGEETSLNDEHDFAESLALSGRYLPDQCFSCEGERAGNLKEAEDILSRYRKTNQLMT